MSNKLSLISLSNDRSKWKWFLTFISISLLIYLPSYRYGFITDFLSWLNKYDEGSWYDVIDCFGYFGLHQVFHFINYGVYTLIGKSFLGWYIVTAMLHGVNTTLVYFLAKKMFGLFRLQQIAVPSLLAATLFLISPYQQETLIWKACLHYLLLTSYSLFAILFLIKYLQRKGNLWQLHLLTLGAFFTLELGLALPFIYLLLVIIYTYSSQNYGLLKNYIYYGFSIQMFLIVFYFLLNQLVFGAWVGHYGAEAHLNFDLLLMAGTAYKYLAKYLFLLHYFPMSQKIIIYQLISGLPFVLLISIMLSMGVLFGLVKRKKDRSNALLIIFCLLAFFMALFPISNLYFQHFNWFENDRYGYLASFFFYIGLALVLCSIKHKALRYLVTSGLLILHSYFFYKMIMNAREAGALCHALVDDFDFFSEDEIVILSLPDNLIGMQIFRDLSGKGLGLLESIDHFRGKKYMGNLKEVAQINVRDRHGITGVNVMDSLTLKVMIGSDGSWFWKDGMGLSNYENEDWKVSLHGWYYLLQLKARVGNRTFIYFKDQKWHKVDWES